MRHFQRLFVWVMVALWLPATLHCAIDRSGLFESKPICCGDEIDRAAESNCAERCDPLSDGVQKLTVGVMKAPAPVLATCFAIFLAIRPAVISVPSISPTDREAPPEIGRTWQFVA